MAKKEAEPKGILEREYIVPLRREWLKVPQYKRANKAVKALKEFMVKHMKLYDRDLKKVKIDKILNNEMRFRGMRKPPARIKVRAIKYDNGIVKVTLVEIPEAIKYKLERENRAAEKRVAEKRPKETKKTEKLEEKIKEREKGEEKEEKTEEKEEEKKEKKDSVVEAGLMQAKQQAKQTEHIKGIKKQPNIHRMAMQK